jgi:3-deoxy-manno-octulosonate cytidylyltransferase (CMP-KDO synthetase)
MKKVVGVIPSRIGSTRFPEKPLAMIAGKPLLAWVIAGARKAKLIGEIIVATDDKRIFDLAVREGAKAVMTESSLPSGSDRAWAAVQNIQCDVVLNIQGDEPLIDGAELDALVDAFNDKSVEMATLGKKIKAEELENLNVAKIICNQRGEAISFSRFAIPHSRDKNPTAKGAYACLKHIGLYGYKKAFLQRFCETGVVDIERAEGLEQMRALWLGARIKVVEHDCDSWGVDTPEDVIRVERILKTERSSRP